MENREIILSVTAPHFCAGAIFKVGENAGKNKWICVKAAPILKYMVGWSSAQAKSYCKEKGWEFEKVDAAAAESLLAIKNTIQWVDLSKSNAWLFTRKNAATGGSEFVIKQLDQGQSDPGFAPEFERKMIGLGFVQPKGCGVVMHKTHELVAPVSPELANKLFSLPGIEKIEVDRGDVDYDNYVSQQVVILSLYRDRHRLYVSHGVNESTLKNVCLPPEPLDYFLRIGARKCDLRGEYVMDVEDFHFCQPMRPELTEQTESSMRL